MLASVQAALNATHAQLANLFPRYGIQLRSQQIWQRLGATVMIGQNDIAGENFTVPDAQGLVRFASATHLGRISMWSLNRDSQCGSSFPESGLLSNTCSGTAQSSLRVLPGLRPAAGRDLGHLLGRRRPARGGQHQPGRRALPAVVRDRRLPVRLQSGRVRGDLPVQVVQHRRRPAGAGAVLLADPLGAARSGAARRSRAGHLQAVGRHLSGVVDQRPVTGSATRCSTRACRTRPSGTTREYPRRASRATRPRSPWKALYKIPGEPTGTSSAASPAPVP